MASTVSSEASEIRRRGRRRLIGAIVLVLLAVVFVPMLLDSEPRPAREAPSAGIPPKESAAPLPPPAPKASVAPSGAKPAAEAPKAAEVKPAEPAKAAPTNAPATGASLKLEGFAVQVGAFRDEAKLAQARDRLTASGVQFYTERVEAKGGALTRLRAGPFATRDAAEGGLAAIKRAGLDGKVIPLQ